MVTLHTRSLSREACKGFFLPVFTRFQGIGGQLGCHGLVCGVVEPFLPSAATPLIHPFVYPSADNSSRPEPEGPDTEYYSATIPRTQAASFRVTPANVAAGPLGYSGWPCAARASSSEEEGPMQPSLPSFSSSRAILVLSGETESGSAGEQPDKG